MSSVVILKKGPIVEAEKSIASQLRQEQLKRIVSQDFLYGMFLSVLKTKSVFFLIGVDALNVFIWLSVFFIYLNNPSIILFLSKCFRIFTDFPKPIWSSM
jgi:hypothetical protein